MSINYSSKVLNILNYKVVSFMTFCIYGSTFNHLIVSAQSKCLMAIGRGSGLSTLCQSCGFALRMGKLDYCTIAFIDKFRYKCKV